MGFPIGRDAFILGMSEPGSSPVRLSEAASPTDLVDRNTFEIDGLCPTALPEQMSGPHEKEVDDPAIAGRAAGLPGLFLHRHRRGGGVSFVYTRITPHNEFQLIRDNEPAAAIALGLSLLGFVLPVVSAIAHSANVLDCLIWSVIALIVQIAVYYLVKIPVPNLSKRIAAGEMAPAIWLGLSSLAAGALNAASMIY